MIIFLSVLLCHLLCLLSSATKQKNTADNDKIIHCREWGSGAHPGWLKYPFWKKCGSTTQQAGTYRSVLTGSRSNSEANAVNKQKSSRAKNGWLRCTAQEALYLSTIISPTPPPSLASIFARDKRAPYTAYRNPRQALICFSWPALTVMISQNLWFLARSPWLQHHRVPFLISDSISREQRTAVAPDAYMPPTLKCAGNLFSSPRCSSSWCNLHKTLSLWYLATKWEEGDKAGKWGITIRTPEDRCQSSLEHPSIVSWPLEQITKVKDNSQALIWSHINQLFLPKVSFFFFSEYGLSTSKLSTI